MNMVDSSHEHGDFYMGDEWDSNVFVKPTVLDLNIFNNVRPTVGLTILGFKQIFHQPILVV